MRKALVLLFCVVMASILSGCSLSAKEDDDEKDSNPVGTLKITNNRPESLTALWIAPYTGTPPMNDGSDLPEKNYLETNGSLARGESFSVTLAEGSYQVYYGFQDSTGKKWFVWLRGNDGVYKITIAENKTFALTVAKDSWSIDASVIASKGTGTAYPSKNYLMQ